MNWFRKFMAGRYGSDQLSTALLILSIILALIAQFLRIPIITIIGYIPLLIGIFRMFSKNIGKRRMENYKFAMIMSPVYSWFKNIIARIKYLNTRKYFRCPKCRYKLWVPKGKGKMIITCPKCKNEFQRKS